uniref:Anaphylatoxin-like domain-containing protein n=1 Tax=Acanthochromis polyacanthus TaxID=80966 RepID=A0A3Q1FEE8_9TELE
DEWLKIQPEAQYKDDLERDCCLDGLSDTSVSYTCERRSEYILEGASCVNAFLNCCKTMENERADRKEDSLQLARSKRRGKKGV